MFDTVNRDNTMKVFLDGRMPPQSPDHKKFIDKELAKLALEDASETPIGHRAADLKKHYDDKLAAYLLENPPVAEVSNIGVVQLEPTEVVESAPKKRGRVAKIAVDSVPSPL